ncbi:hypothetical protein QYE76_042542 [Lolium multiflorum]|uniref:Transposase (putative) gypsy type domain-containing protein n=1 Tax=Lolium multiflorum TaxID=4521 RepID=A0AAD8WV78_LOLMU|nr:hypothetical protein QYE76_042542 [Lolium multiflorum]
MPRGRHRGVHWPLLLPPSSLRALELPSLGERLPLANSGGRFFTDPPPPLHQSGATGPRVSTERPQPPLSPPRSQGSSSPFSLSWSSSSSSSSMASPSGSWRGSYMREDDIERLVRLRRIPRSVITRAPGVELEPTPEPDERVVFGAHLDRGLGLPASAFFRRFLDHFGLQPHHLPANACVLLSCFVAFMEAYAGLWPDIDFWSRLFYLKAQTNDGRLRACGAASIYTRPGTPFPKIPTVDSVKNWQMSFFYVRNEGGLVDRINLPEFNPAPPVGRINWSHNARSTDQNAEVNLLWDFLATAATGGLTAEDLLCTIAERRVLPLQMRTHKIGHMSGRFDPNRTSKVLLNKAQVASRVNHITKANLSEDWSYGLAPCDRDHPPARLFERQNVEDGDLATRRWTPDHVDPADQTGETAGDDDLPQAPDLGGQGERNPPPSPEQQEEEEPATSGTGPIPAVPLRTRPPSTTATSAPKGTKRGEGEETAPAAAEDGPGAGRVCPGRRLPASSARCVAASPPEEGADAAAFLARTYAAAAAVLRCARGAFFAVPLASAPIAARVLSRLARCAGRHVPGRTRLRLLGLAQACRRRQELRSRTAQAHGPAGLRRHGGVGQPEGHRAPETAGRRPSLRWAAARRSRRRRSRPGEPAGEPARTEGADSRALVRTGTSSASPQGLHVAKGALLLQVPSASDASLGSAATMEQAWLGADSYEANLKARAAEAAANVAKVEEAGKAVMDRRTTLYNRAVTHYHKAKLDRIDLARELEAVKVEAAKVPAGVGSPSRSACGESEEAGRLPPAKLKLAEQELTRLRRWRRIISPSSTPWGGEGEAAFPETQEAALTAVGIARESRRQATGEGSSEYFSVEDHLASMAARVDPITKLGWELRKAAWCPAVA